MALDAVNDYVARFGSGHWAQFPFQFEQVATTSFGAVASSQMVGQLVLPALPSGVTNYIVTRAHAYSQQGTTFALLLAHLIDLGSIDISGASGTFTDGSAMPTVDEGGVSRVTNGAILMEITTVLNATPGALTITYTDQDGNTGQSSGAMTLPASGVVGSAGFATLAGTDCGARDITAASRSAGTTPTGVIKFWGVRPIAVLTPLSNIVAFCADNLIGPAGFNPLRLPDSARIGIVALGNVTAKTVIGGLDIIGDD